MINAARPATMPPAIDSTGTPPTFVNADVVLVELFAELVVVETWTGAEPHAGPPTIEMAPYDDAVKVRVRFEPSIET
jgi:hypothetical protein